MHIQLTCFLLDHSRDRDYLFSKLKGITRGLNFWCGEAFEGGQVTFLIYFENVFLVRSIFLRNFGDSDVGDIVMLVTL